MVVSGSRQGRALRKAHAVVWMKADNTHSTSGSRSSISSASRLLCGPFSSNRIAMLREETQVAHATPHRACLPAFTLATTYAQRRPVEWRRYNNNDTSAHAGSSEQRLLRSSAAAAAAER